MKPSALFGGKSLKEVLAERHKVRDALLADAVTKQEQEQVQQAFDINDAIFVRIFNGETPPPGFRIHRVTLTRTRTREKFTMWTCDQNI